MSTLSLYVTCPRGLEFVLANELKSLGLASGKESIGGVYVEADLAQYYHIIVHSRIANRALILMESFDIKDSRDLLAQCQHVPWDDYFALEASFAIKFYGTNAQIKNTMFAAQVVKDGLCDYFKKKYGQRPNVEKYQPDVQIVAYLKRNQVRIYLEPVGQSLHLRGYRTQQGEAPLKENVAAGLLHLANWPKMAKDNMALIDPFCGAGTFLIEALMIATDKAPGTFMPQSDSLQHFKGHDEVLYHSVLDKAQAQHQQALSQFKGQIIGFDNDARVIKKAQQNIAIAGFSDLIQVSVKDIKHFKKPRHLSQGLLICNPPYGERLDTLPALLPLYQTLGHALKHECDNWQAAVLSMDEKLTRAIGLKSHRQYQVKNGALDCLLALFSVDKNNHFNKDAYKRLSDDAQMLTNRLKKNQKQLTPWLKNNDIECYRLYDADLPEFNAAIDVYKDWVHVQEYKAPSTIDEKKAKKRLQIMLDALSFGLGFDAEQIVVKERARQKGKSQYNSLSKTYERILIKEGSINCLVNLKDYLDTGLFLDHRRLRQFFAKLKGDTFLNLFSYTGVASLHAHRAGFKTTNVDLSKTYLNWAKDNFRKNHFTIDANEFIHADVIAWLKENKKKYDVIFCDPPSFSNSKRMADILDIEKDHPDIIALCMKALKPGGLLYFSCNKRKFKLSPAVASTYQVEDLTKEMTSKDFYKAKNGHCTFLIKTKGF